MVTPEKALEQARNAEKRVMTDTPEGPPPLLGVHVPSKDLAPVAGLPVTYGSRTHQGTVASPDAGVVSRLREAGAVFLGGRDRAVSSD